jgi:hypothetical protein
MVAMSAETEQRALEILEAPMTALAFADHFWPDRTDRPPGKRALGGHAMLRRFVDSGSVRRIEGSSPSSDLFVASNAAFEGRNGAPPASDQPEEGELEYEDGYAVRVRKEVLGPIAMPPPPQPRRPPQQQPAPQYAPQPQPIPQQHAQVPTPPQATREQIYEQFCAWTTATLPEVQAIKTLLSEAFNWRRLDGSPIYEWEEREDICEEAQARMQAHVVGMYWWYKKLGWGPPILWLDQLERRLSAPPPPPRALARGPSPRSPMHRGYAPISG